MGMAQPSPFPTSCSSLGTFRAPTPPCRSWSPPQPATAPTPALDRDLRHRGLSGRPADPHSEGREGRTLTALCCTFTTAPPPAFRRWTTPRRHSRSTWPTAPQNAAHRSPDSRLVLDAKGRLLVLRRRCPTLIGDITATATTSPHDAAVFRVDAALDRLELLVVVPGGSAR